MPRETEATSSFAFDIRSPLHSHENQFPTLYDLCKIDLPNGRTDASSLVTLAKGERDLWPSLIFELETSRVPDAIHRSRIENELLLFLQNEEISLSLSLFGLNRKGTKKRKTFTLDRVGGILKEHCITMN